MSVKTRQPYFDSLKFFAMFLVIWGHCVERCVSRPCTDEPMWHFIYTFHMPLFMIISGYFSLSTIFNNGGWKYLIVRKSKTLLLPVLSWTVIFILIQPLFGLSNFNFLNTLWFLRCLFLCYLLHFVGSKLHFKGWQVLTILISQAVPVSFYNVPIMYPCFALGAFLRERPALFTSICKHWWAFTPIFLVLMYFTDYHLWLGISLKGAISGHDWNALGLYGFGRLHRILTGVMGAFVFIGLFKWLHETGAKGWLVQKIRIMGQYTLEMYILQTLFTGLVLRAWIHLDDMNLWTFNFVVTPVMSVLIVVASMAVVWLVRRSPWLNLLLFGK